RDPIHLLQLAGIADVNTGTLASAREALGRLETKLPLSPSESLRATFQAVRVAKHVIEIDIDPAAFRKLADLPASTSNETDPQTFKTVRFPVQLRRRGVETRLVINNDTRASASRDPKL